MNKYRLVETKIVDGTGKGSFEYSIQKKLFFFWVPATLITHYFTHNGRALLIGRNYTYTNKERALRVLDHLNNPYSEICEGYKIVRVLDDDDFHSVFINKDDITTWDGSNCYEYDNSLELLKQSIKEKVKTKSRKVIA